MTAQSDADRRLLSLYPDGVIQVCHLAGYPDHVRVHRLVTAASARPHDVCGYAIQPIVIESAASGGNYWRPRRGNEAPFVDSEDYLSLSKGGVCPPALDDRYVRVSGVNDLVFVRTITEIATILENRSTISRSRFLDGKGPCASQTYDCLRLLFVGQASNWRQEKHTDVSIALDLEGQRIFRELRLADDFTGMLR